MSELTNDQIALLCEIGEHDRLKVDDHKQGDLRRLFSDGFIEQKKSQSEESGSGESLSGPALQLTAKAIAFLGERGAGLNEA